MISHSVDSLLKTHSSKVVAIYIYEMPIQHGQYAAITKYRDREGEYITFRSRFKTQTNKKTKKLTLRRKPIVVVILCCCRMVWTIKKRNGGSTREHCICKSRHTTCIEMLIYQNENTFNARQKVKQWKLASKYIRDQVLTLVYLTFFFFFLNQNPHLFHILPQGNGK